MVSVLQPTPTPGARLGGALGGGVSQGLQMLVQAKVQQMQQSQELANLARTLQSVRGPGAEEELIGAEEYQGISPEQLAVLSTKHPEAAKIIQKSEEQKKEVFEKKQEKARLNKVFAEMEKTLKGGNLGITPKRLTPQGRRDRQYFDTLAVALENIASTMVGKGVLSKPRFEFLIKNLPGSGKTDARNEGSLKAWALELGLSPGSVEVEGVEEEIPQGAKKSKTLDQILFR